MGHLEDGSPISSLSVYIQIEPGTFCHAIQWMSFLICFPTISSPSCLEWMEFSWYVIKPSSKGSNIENFKVGVGGHEFKVGLVEMYCVPTSQPPMCMSHNLLTNLSLPFISPQQALGLPFPLFLSIGFFSPVCFLYSNKSLTCLCLFCCFCPCGLIPLSISLLSFVAGVDKGEEKK